MTELLRVENLTKHFPIRRGVFRRQVGAVRAVDGIDLSLEQGDTLSLVGESGCGKSTTGRLIVRLLDPTAGRIVFQGRDLATLHPREMRPLRRDVQIMFQDPYASLSPRMTVHDIVAEPLRVQGRYRAGGPTRVAELLELVGLAPDHANRYAHEFSGGQRQRIGLARALALDPKLLVLDEPVSALDVSIQAQVVNQLRDLQRRLGLTYLFISHNLSVVQHIADNVLVMYLGKSVEYGSKHDTFSRPLHPYTRALLASTPHIDPAQRQAKIMLAGEPPSPLAPPPGCAFHNRCPYAVERCRIEVPLLLPYRDSLVACHRVDEI